MSKTLKGHIALLFVQIIYALNYSLAKGLMPDYISPLSIVFFRVLGAGILFWILSLFVKTQALDKKDIPRLLVLALCGAVLNQLFFIYGLSMTTPINSSIIMISSPIIVFILTMVVLKERITWIKSTGLVLAIAGAVMILRYKGDFEVGSDTIQGDLYTLINAALWSVFMVLTKPIMEKYNTVTAMRWVFLFSSIFIFPFGFKDAFNTDWSHFTPQAWFALSFVILATTFIAYLLNVYGLQVLSASTTSAYIYLQPLLASFFAILGGKDAITSTKLISGILIIFGLYLINIKTNKAPA